MLAADKLQLQSALKQQATALKEKEFNLHHSNLMTVGTQAAVLAGLDITLFIEFSPPDTTPTSASLSDLAWNVWLFLMLMRLLKFIYYITIVTAFCANMVVVSHTTALSVLGAGLALRGPDGSMVVATDALYEERRSVFVVFAIGLACTVGSVVICVWLILHWEAAFFCMCMALYTCYTIYKNYQRVVQRFYYNEHETVSFDDIFHGPAAIQVVPATKTATATTRPSSSTNRYNAQKQKSSISSSLICRRKNNNNNSHNEDDDEESNSLMNSELIPQRIPSPSSTDYHHRTVTNSPSMSKRRVVQISKYGDAIV